MHGSGFKPRTPDLFSLQGEFLVTRLFDQISFFLKKKGYLTKKNTFFLKKILNTLCHLFDQKYKPFINAWHFYSKKKNPCLAFNI